jgi:aryl-alcohol dehydrogenase-like predicted oxidoreductase
MESSPFMDVESEKALTTASGAPVAPLGLAARGDAFREAVPIAAERGVNLFFTYGPGKGGWTSAIAEVAARRREEIFIATGTGSRRPQYMRASLRKYARAIGTDYLDVFFVEYAQPWEDLEPVFAPGGALDELVACKEEGLIRHVGATAHDRALSRRLAEDPRVDVLMQRYNMAHRKAADEVFPACRRHGKPIVAFTATRWGSLMEGHAEWVEAAPSAAECYRFCMAHPDIAVTLSAPASAAELDENLAVLEQPPMTAAARDHWKRYGDLVYGDGTGRFETEWP